jgi:hypothetical protein
MQPVEAVVAVAAEIGVAALVGATIGDSVTPTVGVRVAARWPERRLQAVAAIRTMQRTGKRMARLSVFFPPQQFTIRVTACLDQLCTPIADTRSRGLLLSCVVSFYAMLLDERGENMTRCDL